MVLDLNKCLGCQTCTIACKTQWTRGPGMEPMWWNIVSTMPGRGTPATPSVSAGAIRDGEPVPGELPGKREWGEAWDFDYDQVLWGANGDGQHRDYLRPARARRRFSAVGPQLGRRPRWRGVPQLVLLLPAAAVHELQRPGVPRGLPAATRSTGARKTVSSSSTRIAATVTGSAPKPARTSASTSTSRGLSPRSATRASPASRRTSRRPA